MEEITVVRPLCRDDGPVELGTLQLELVSGGLPRSGWGDLKAEPIPSSESSLPRSGWGV
jgi:hypothetical protein